MKVKIEKKLLVHKLPIFTCENGNCGRIAKYSAEGVYFCENCLELIKEKREVIFPTNFVPREPIKSNWLMGIGGSTVKAQLPKLTEEKAVNILREEGKKIVERLEKFLEEEYAD